MELHHLRHIGIVPGQAIGGDRLGLTYTTDFGT